ncbi:hypothetical protein DM860_012408 [Cuscuta australis]|uniref:Uncharacterized protein n=1 Tax=Cuscuta australis TaxID=267555 RepID=A0A328DUQ2_9ASTE|nr:hypothetical protein DM860_012408 [Cuscuta australis]
MHEQQISPARIHMNTNPKPISTPYLCYRLPLPNKYSTDQTLVPSHPPTSVLGQVSFLSGVRNHNPIRTVSNNQNLRYEIQNHSLDCNLFPVIFQALYFLILVVILKISTALKNQMQQFAFQERTQI